MLGCCRPDNETVDLDVNFDSLDVNQPLMHCYRRRYHQKMVAKPDRSPRVRT